VIIRQANTGDAPSLSDLAKETYTAAFDHSFTPSDLAAHLEKNLSPNNFERMLERDAVLVAEEIGRLIGYVQFGPADPATLPAQGGDQELRRLYVHADFQNQGVGTRLMNAAVAHPQLRDAERIFLDVWEHNPNAQRFYARFGFEVIGDRSFVVESGAQTSKDLIMVRVARFS
jgi:ribosomal protein S18 acetylase RimI-like enzyme